MLPALAGVLTSQRQFGIHPRNMQMLCLTLGQDQFRKC